jgi:tetratricopeptide (TPR) repeat protein
MRITHTTALGGIAFALGLFGWEPQAFSKSALETIMECIDERDDARAFALCDSVVDTSEVSDTERGLALMGRGFALSRMKACEKAISDFTEALPLLEEKSVVYTSRGACYTDLGDYERALADYDTAIAFDSEDASNYTSRGLFYLETSKPDRALADYDKALVLEPDSDSAHRGRALAFGQKGDYDAALAAVSAAVRIRPKDASFYRFRAEIHLLKGQTLAAASDADKAIALEPEAPLNHLTRAAALFVDGDFRGAVKHAEEGARRNPRNNFAYLWIIMLKGRLSDGAAPQAERPEAATAWPAAILDLYQGKSGEEQVRAVVAASDLLDQRARNCAADFYLAEWDRNHGRTEAARRKLEHARDTCPLEQLERALAIAELRRL